MPDNKGNGGNQSGEAQQPQQPAATPQQVSPPEEYPRIDLRTYITKSELGGKLSGSGSDGE